MAAVLSLSEYLSNAALRPFVWGQCDCLLWPADWVLLNTGYDPAAACRGRYGGEREARRMMRAGGGIERLVGAGCAAMLPVGRPAPLQAGDVGLVRVPMAPRGRRLIEVPAGAIYLGAGLWSVKTRDGVSAMPFTVLRAWSLKPIRLFADAGRA